MIEEWNKRRIYSLTTDIEYLDLRDHQHEDHHQLVYMIKGTSHVLFEKSEYFLPEGFIGLIPSGQMHNIRSRNEMVKMFLLYFPANISLSKFLSFSANDFMIENIRFISKKGAALDSNSDKTVFDFVSSFLRLLLNMATENQFPLKGLIAPKNERLRSVLNYLRTNYSENITLSKVASELGFTVRNLTRLFKKENISFNNYLNYIRIIHAIELFSEHRDNISGVAFEVGYNSASNFGRTFKKYTGKTPGEFIRNNSTKSIE